MRVQVIVAVGLIAATVRCGPTAEKCGEAICTKEQRCTPAKTCVTDNPPSVTVESPLQGAMITATSVEVKGSATDDDQGMSADVSTNKATWIPLKLGSNGTFSLQLPLPMLDASAGSVTVRARDSKGHEVQVTRALQVDNVPPTCKITSPLDGVYLNGTTPVMVTMIAADGSQVLANPKFSTDNGTTFSTPSASNGDFGFNWSQGSENGVVHPLIFRVDDASGHTCEATASVTVDNVKPTIAISAPLSSSLLGVPFYTAGGVVTGVAADGMKPLKSVTFDFNDGMGLRNATLSTTGNNVWTVNLARPGDDYVAHNATAVATDLGGNTATATLTVTVDVKPPVLTLTNPAPGAKLNASNFPASNNVQLMWTLGDGDSQLTIGLVMPDGGFVTPPVLPTASTDNPKAYTANFRANDRAGNISTASVSFTVDRVLPFVTLTTPANNARMFVGNTTADFSEPMMGGAGLSMNPFVAGSWTTPQRYEVGNLAKDQVYQAATGSATDLHGNPIVASSYRFHTETWQPLSGAVLINNYTVVQEATTDVEGTLNLIAKNATNGSIDWIQFNPVTGVSNIVDSNPSASFGRMVVAARTVQTDLTSRRLAGFTVDPNTGDVVRYNINGGAPVTVAGAVGFIPTPAFNGEGTGLGEFGIITGGFYKRTGRADVAIPMPYIDTIHPTSTHWQIVAPNGGGTDSQDFGCAPLDAGVPTCALSAIKTLGGFSSGNPNSASSQNCTIHGYLASGVEKTTLFRWQPSCGGPTNPCASDITENNNFDQVVADLQNDGVFYGYTNDGFGNYQVKKRVLSASNCSGAITNVGAPIGISLTATQGIPRIVVIRGVPGLIFPVNSSLVFQSP